MVIVSARGMRTIVALAVWIFESTAASVREPPIYDTLCESAPAISSARSSTHRRALRPAGRTSERERGTRYSIILHFVPL